MKEKIYAEYIGSDESGVGDYFGPLVVAAVSWSDKIDSTLRDKGIRVRDSKTLSNKYINWAGKKLISFLDFEVFIFDNPLYNRMIEMGFNQNVLKTLGHLAVISLLLKQRGRRKRIIVDSYANFKNISKYLSQLSSLRATFSAINLSIPIISEWIFVKRAEESYAGVAAASMISRFFFLQEMDKLSKKASLRLPLGSGKNTTDFLQNIVVIIRNKQNFANFINRFAKFHFRLTRFFLDKNKNRLQN